MIVSIHQPNYLPYLGYFDKISKCDLFILYDTAFFVKEMFYNRNKVKTNQGEKWLTVPVYYKLQEQQQIRDIQIENKRNWKKKHWQTITQNYSKSAFFTEICDLLSPFYQEESFLLSDFTVNIITAICSYLEIKTKIILASSIPTKSNLDRTQKLLNICLELGATTYLSGTTGNKYLDELEFSKNNINIEYQNYDHPIYNQLHGDFVKYMCVLDVLFNHGKKSKEILVN